MFKMIEVVGRSPEGYSEAVKSAIETLMADGEKIHFFTVQEQRGSTQGGTSIEYQVVVKVAVEM